MGASADERALTALVDRLDVDVFALQELTPAGDSALRVAGVHRHLPFAASFPLPRGERLGRAEPAPPHVDVALDRSPSSTSAAAAMAASASASRPEREEARIRFSRKG